MANLGHVSPRPRSIHSTNVTLLNAIHTSYLHSKPYQLDARTRVVANAWHTSSQATPIVDTLLGEKVWEHARRRLENNCVLLQYVSNLMMSIRVLIAEIGLFILQLPRCSSHFSTHCPLPFRPRFSPRFAHCNHFFTALHPTTHPLHGMPHSP